MKGHTTNIEQERFIFAFCKGSPYYIDPFKAEVELTEACKNGVKLSSYFLFKIESQYCILNLNNGYMVSWFDIFGRNAFVNRPEFDSNYFTGQIKNILTELHGTK